MDVRWWYAALFTPPSPHALLSPQPGYARLCSTFAINPKNFNFGGVSICRVPKNKLEPGKLVQDQTTGCLGCATGAAGNYNIFGNKYGQNLADIQIERERRAAKKKEEAAKAKAASAEGGDATGAAGDDGSDSDSSSHDDDAAGPWLSMAADRKRASKRPNGDAEGDESARPSKKARGGAGGAGAGSQ